VEKSVLLIDVRPGEYLELAEMMQVELIQKSGQLARLRVVAPRDVKIVKKFDQQASKHVPSMAN